MGFFGIWMMESESMVYCVVLKCVCLFIGQIMFFFDYGWYFDGDIYDFISGLYKWSQEVSQCLIEESVKVYKLLIFICVCNFYGCILLLFFDKIVGIQCNGKCYWGNLVLQLIQCYGIDVGSFENNFDFDQIVSFC